MRPYLLLALVMGCKSVGEPAAPVTAAATQDKVCPPELTIDDAEDKDNQILRREGRGGYWYTFLDKVGSTIAPAAGGKFTMANPWASMSGTLAGSGEPIFAGMGFSFKDPKSPYDASAFTGVSFSAKVNGDSIAAVRLKVPDASTDPLGKVCTECFNDFGADLTLTREWKRYVVSFASMKQLEGWGAPHPAAIDKSKVYGLQWQVVTSSAKYDIAVDDIQFTGCP